MKKIIFLIIFITVLIIAGIFAAGPYVTIHKIKSGIVNHDAEQISAQVDFRELRKNIKEQFNAQVTKETEPYLKDNPFAALGLALASKLVDNIVDMVITPNSIANLMEGNKALQSRVKEGTKNDNNRNKEPFKNARYKFESLSKFSASIRSENEEEMRFIFTRNGLSWKLSNIQFPMNFFDGDSSSVSRNQLTEEPSVSDQKIKIIDYELQEKCGKLSRAMFKEEFGSGIVYQDGKKITSDFTNHYNKKLNKCFVLVNLTIHINNEENKIEKNRLRTLLDVNELKEYGAVIIFNNGELDSCRVSDKVCKSEQEWDSFVKPYMED